MVLARRACVSGAVLRTLVFSLPRAGPRQGRRLGFAGLGLASAALGRMI